MKIACIQHSFKGTPEKTIAYTEKKIREASAENADIICLQELFSLPYFCRKVDRKNFSLAEEKDSKLKARFSSLAGELGVVLIVPFFEKRDSGVYNNSVFIIDADGKISGIYRKSHIPDDPCFFEKYYFAPGETGFRVFKTKFGPVSVLICWDQWYPEASRIAALKGAGLIVFPTAIGIIKGEEKSEKKFMDAWITIQRSHAIANGVFVASVNRTGTEGELEFWGNSFICDTFGRILAKAGRTDAVIYADMNPEEINDTRTEWPFMRDRRLDLYRDIIKRTSVR